MDFYSCLKLINRGVDRAQIIDKHQPLLNQIDIGYIIYGTMDCQLEPAC